MGIQTACGLCRRESIIEDDNYAIPIIKSFKKGPVPTSVCNSCINSREFYFLNDRGYVEINKIDRLGSVSRTFGSSSGRPGKKTAEEMLAAHVVMVRNENGRVLWFDRCAFGTVYTTGGSFKYKGRQYLVLDVIIRTGQYGDFLVEYVVEDKSENTRACFYAE